MKKFNVIFLSPGTFISETSTKEIESIDLKLAMQMSKSIVKRYKATPYGFYFEEVIASDPIEVDGHKLKVVSEVVNRTGTYFISGKLKTIEDIESESDPKDHILLSNMRCNDWPIVVEVVRGYKSTMPFEEKDFIIDEDGNVVERGDDPKHVEYRNSKVRQ